MCCALVPPLPTPLLSLLLLLLSLALFPCHSPPVPPPLQVPFASAGHPLLLKWLCLCLGKLCQDMPEVSVDPRYVWTILRVNPSARALPTS